MKTKKQLKYNLSLLVLCLVFSQSFAQFEIKKHTINSGGAKMTGGHYELRSSMGQVDASPKMSQGNYSLTGGFWQQNTDLIFKNGFE